VILRFWVVIVQRKEIKKTKKQKTVKLLRRSSVCWAS
jgi:hypothetical protein